MAEQISHERLHTMAFLLTADIGSTTAGFGPVPKGEHRPNAVRLALTADGRSPEVAARQCLAEMGEAKFFDAVIALADLIGPGTLGLTNGPWVLDRV